MNPSIKLWISPIQFPIASSLLGVFEIRLENNIPNLNPRKAPNLT